MPTNIQDDLQTSGKSKYGSFCIKNIAPDPTIHESKTRPNVPGSGCVPTKLGAHVSIRFPAFQSYRKGVKEGTKSSDRHDHNNSHMGNSTLVPNTIGNVNTTTSTHTNVHPSTTGPSRDSTPTDPKQNPPTRSMAGLRQNLEDKTLPTRVTNLITSARSTGTRLNYNSTWKKFCGWCSEQKVDPIQCHIIYILDFLASLFDKGLAYRTVNVYRSSISAQHGHIGGKPIGVHKEICALMKGISNKRPPTPRYCNTWDVTIVLDYIKTWGNNESLTDKYLTLKLTFLLAVTSAHRGSELKLLKTNLMNQHNEFIIFHFDTKLKTTKQGKTPPKSEFHKFEGDEDLCPVSCLNCYLTRSTSWRSIEADGTHNPNQLLLSHIKPHNIVTKSTIARWLKDVLNLAGINVNIYKAHSTRSAASSKAEALGLCIEEIIQQGNWSNKNTFEKFYKKPIETHSKAFQQKVLNREPRNKKPL